MDEMVKTGVVSIDAATLNGMLERDEIVLVDVRETSEFEQEHIPGAMLLPMSAMAGEKPMGFFITSTGSGNGANLGGLDGGDGLFYCFAAD